MTFAGCTAVPVVDDNIRALVGHLSTGHTSRHDIESRYGGPINTYEEGRIAAWLLVERDGELRIATGLDHRGGFNLMLDFGDDDVVDRYNIVAVR